MKCLVIMWSKMCQRVRKLASVFHSLGSLTDIMNPPSPPLIHCRCSLIRWNSSSRCVCPCRSKSHREIEASTFNLLIISFVLRREHKTYPPWLIPFYLSCSNLSHNPSLAVICQPVRRLCSLSDRRVNAWSSDTLLAVRYLPHGILLVGFSLITRNMFPYSQCVFWNDPLLIDSLKSLIELLACLFPWVIPPQPLSAAPLFLI